MLRSLKSIIKANPTVFRFALAVRARLEPPVTAVRAKFRLVPTGEVRLRRLLTLIARTIEEDVSSLSAILMDTGYYAFIQSGRREVDGLPAVGAAHLITLKARAWLDLTQREKNGERIDGKTIKKHKNDVFRLYQILDPTINPAAPEAVKRDLRDFISRMAAEDVDLKSLGFRSGTRDEVLADLSKVYRLG